MYFSREICAGCFKRKDQIKAKTKSRSKYATKEFKEKIINLKCGKINLFFIFIYIKI
jgi:hypothetical protein